MLPHQHASDTSARQRSRAVTAKPTDARQQNKPEHTPAPTLTRQLRHCCISAACPWPLQHRAHSCTEANQQTHISRTCGHNHTTCSTNLDHAAVSLLPLSSLPSASAAPCTLTHKSKPTAAHQHNSQNNYVIWFCQCMLMRAYSKHHVQLRLRVQGHSGFKASSIFFHWHYSAFNLCGACHLRW
jgi:hypothetical protein